MLTVYKASAGSGKTFRLAVEYIKQLIISPQQYEHILAVTFTNKATEEMKMRILSQLYGLAHQLKDSKSYMNVIMDDFRKSGGKYASITENEIAERASMALSILLHNYSFFRVETIDKFFQRVLRNLARELDLSPNLRVELSSKDVEHRAVDTWIESLKDGDTELNWIMDYIRTNMDENKKWNVIEEIKKFGEQLISDDYKQHSSQLTERFDGDDKEFYNRYTSQLVSIIKGTTNKFNEAGKELWGIIIDNGLDENAFTQKKRGVAGFILNMSTANVADISINSYVKAALDPDDEDATHWTPKTASAAIKELCRTVLRPKLIELMRNFAAEQKMVRTAQVTLKHLSKLRMLKAIQQEINRSNAEHDRFLLSDTQALLSQMIEDSDSPFIYEKIGSRLNSIMIDEFQDTSRIQWQNFKVLLNDCMAQGHDNLIVGDVKQSIYRWRSGDWRLLNNINEEFRQDIKEEPLRVNRRSSTNIIDFNNAFFSYAATKVYEEAKEGCRAEDVDMLRKAYSDVCQEYPDDKEHSGYVEIRLIDKEDYNETMLNYITDTIINLVENGVNQNDIAILVRTNKVISQIALYCNETFRNSDNKAIRDIRIVSDEGFLLKASHAVCIIIDAIRLLLNPEDKIVKVRLSLLYQRFILESQAPQQELLEQLLLPEEYAQDMDNIITMPLYQLCEHIYSIFRIDKLDSQSAYVCCFFDCLCEYITNSVGDVPGLIKEWDEHMCNKSVESDSTNGLRIMTLHKSKGLEFGHVIMPYCDWKHEQGQNMLWCEPKAEPFSQLPLLPINYSKKELEDTIYEPEYWEEHMQNLVDNINLLYVGFTRAVDSLYIFSKKAQNNGFRGHIIENALPYLKNELKEKGELTFDDDFLSFGSISFQENTKEETDDEEEKNVFLQKSEPLKIHVTTNNMEPVFMESNESKEFVNTDEEDENEEQRNQYIQLGNVLHSVLQNIRTVNDIPSAILEMEMKGLLSGQDITADMIHDHIAQSMENPQIADWFSDKWRLYNECTILEYIAKNDKCIEHRPDRVMTDGKTTIVVDFKLFSFKQSYRDQVRRYMSLLKQMGHKNVRGYLWLVMANKVIEVD